MDADGRDPLIGASARRRVMVYGLSAVVVATATALVVWQVVAEYEAQLERVKGEIDAESAVFATVDLPAGHLIGPDEVELRRYPVGDPELPILRDVQAAVGMTTGVRILRGEPIRAERLTTSGTMPRLDEVIDPGARAVAVLVDRDEAVGGLLVPGTYVDVMVTIRPDDDQLSADWVADTILQGVRVLAIDETIVHGDAGVNADRLDTKDGARGPQKDLIVTLEVEPAEAEGLALAASRGDLRLTLRADGDLAPVSEDGPLVTNALLGVPPPVKQAQTRRLARKREVVERKQRITMELIRGRTRTTEDLGLAEEEVP